MPHGAAHLRAAEALRQAFAELAPRACTVVLDTLRYCSPWFRAYYNSYLIPLALWPGLWRRIENQQRQGDSTNPLWLYRHGARPLFRFLRDFAPDAVMATEVGTCELAALSKREMQGRFVLAALELMDFNRGWIQPEVDLLLTTHPDLAEEMIAAGAPAAKVITTGQPIDPAFASLPSRSEARRKVGIPDDAVHLLVLLGGAGHGKPELILDELMKVTLPHETAVITGRSRRLENRLRRRASPHLRILGWVDNMHEWMAASDLMISKPGGGTLNEGFACGLPMLAFLPLPGNEERTCRWLEQWDAGIYIRNPSELAPAVESLLRNPARLDALRRQARALARPHAARDAARSVLALIRPESTLP